MMGEDEPRHFTSGAERPAAPRQGPAPLERQTLARLTRRATPRAGTIWWGGRGEART